MAANNSHTDVICHDEHQQIPVPSCPHGPALLFERYCTSSKEVKKFFACSAFRDRKACSFFRWADSVKESAGESDKHKFLDHETHKSQRKRFLAFKKLPVSQRHVCCTCGLLLLPGEITNHEGQGHLLKKEVKKDALQQPSHLFVPLEDNKTFAQYLFSEKSLDFIVDALSSRCSHILCIGTPRIHEVIQNLRKDDKTEVNSFLLDLDKRYGQFYTPQQFARYNMFNHHFFEESGKNHLTKFLNSAKIDDCMFAMDPPFGGMVEPLALSLSKLSSLYRDGTSDLEPHSQSVKRSCTVSFMLFFPYFMEKRILASLKDVTMLDYKVDYDNHDLYKNNGKKKKGSPVRIFVHESLTSLKLPSEEGYWWCEPCGRFSSPENWHCTDCAACTSKDGTKYVHCEICERCVKPSRVHCFTCNMCQLQDHKCQTAAPTGCYICGGLDHKKRECPKKAEHSKKRSAKERDSVSPHHRKKKRVK